MIEAKTATLTVRIPATNTRAQAELTGAIRAYLRPGNRTAYSEEGNSVVTSFYLVDEPSRSIMLAGVLYRLRTFADVSIWDEQNNQITVDAGHTKKW